MSDFRSRIGIFVSPGLTPERIALAQWADKAGLHSVWTPDAGDGDSLSQLAVLGHVTNRIQLGTGVAVSHRPPVFAAHSALRTSAIADGRLIFGIGTGFRDEIEDWYGMSYDNPIGRLREYTAVLRGLFVTPRGEPFSFAGTYYQVRNVGRTFDAPAPPIWFATAGEQMNRAAGEIADGVLLAPTLSFRYLRETAVPAVIAGARAAGRPRTAVTIAATVLCVIDNDSRVALRRTKESIRPRLLGEFYDPIRAKEGFGPETTLARARYAAGDPRGAADALSDEFINAVAIAGTKDQVRRRLGELLDTVDLIVLSLPPSPTTGGTESSLDELLNDLINET